MSYPLLKITGEEKLNYSYFLNPAMNGWLYADKRLSAECKLVRK